VLALAPSLPRWRESKPRDYMIVVDGSQARIVLVIESVALRVPLADTGPRAAWQRGWRPPPS